MKLSILSASRWAEFAGCCIGLGGFGAVWYQGPTMGVLMAVLGVCLVLSAMVVGALVWSVHGSKGQEGGLSFSARVSGGRVDAVREVQRGGLMAEDMVVASGDAK